MNCDLDRGLCSLLAALPAYEEAARYFDGSIDEVFHGPKMQRQLTQMKASKLRLNFAQTAVTTVANRLDIAGYTVANNSTSVAALDHLWQENELDLELPGLFLHTLVYGDSYLVLDGDDADGIQIFYNNPLNMRIIYCEDNPRKKDFAIKRWQIESDDGAFIRVNLIYPDRYERYITSKKNAKGAKSNEFIPYTGPDEDDTDSVIEHSYGFIPVYHFRTARPYGMPEHKHAYGAQDAVNKLAITHMATIDYLGFPQRYFLMDAGQDSTDIDDFDADIFHDPVTPEATTIGPDAYASRRIPTSSLTADVGGVWQLNAKSVGQFQAADSKQFLDSLNTYIRIMAQLTDTPLHYFDPTGQAPSGESLRTADAPLVKRVTTRQLSFGGTLQDCLNEALTIYGLMGPVRVHWASAASVDDVEGWKSVAFKIAAGVPVRQALIEQGYTPVQLDAWEVPEAKYKPAPEPVKVAPASLPV